MAIVPNMFLKGDFIMNEKMIEMLNRINEKIDNINTMEIEEKFSDPAAAMKGDIKRIIDSELAPLEGRLPAPDDLIVAELDNLK